MHLLLLLVFLSVEIVKMLWCLLACTGFVPKVVGKKQTTPAETPPFGNTKKQLTLVNIFRLSMCIYLPGFICILVIFVLICTGNVTNKLIYGMRAHQNTWRRVSQAWKWVWKMKQWHFVLLVKMVNWHGCRQVCRLPLADCLHMCSGFPTKIMEQTSVTSLNDITRISHA